MFSPPTPWWSRSWAPTVLTDEVKIEDKKGPLGIFPRARLLNSPAHYQPSRPRVGMISSAPRKTRRREVMLGALARAYEVSRARRPKPLVNTCAFLEGKQSRSTRSWVVGRKGKGVEKVLVAGCMVNRFGKELAKEIPEIDGFVGLDQLRDVGEVVQLGGGPPLPAPAHMVFDHTAPRLLTTRGFAYLKVAEGCNNPCTFCAIRYGADAPPADRSWGGGPGLEEIGIAELNSSPRTRPARRGSGLGATAWPMVRGCWETSIT